MVDPQFPPSPPAGGRSPSAPVDSSRREKGPARPGGLLISAAILWQDIRPFQTGTCGWVLTFPNGGVVNAKYKCRVLCKVEMSVSTLSTGIRWPHGIWVITSV